MVDLACMVRVVIPAKAGIQSAAHLSGYSQHARVGGIIKSADLTSGSAWGRLLETLVEIHFSCALPMEKPVMGEVKGRTSLLSSPMCEAAAFLGGACWPSSLPITGARCAPSKAAVATTENPAADANALRAGVSGVRPLAAKTIPAVESVRWHTRLPMFLSCCGACAILHDVAKYGDNGMIPLCREV